MKGFIFLIFCVFCLSNKVFSQDPKWTEWSPEFIEELKRLDVAEWREEVLLNDGEIVVLSRREEREHYSFLGYSRGKYRGVEFRHDDFGVQWSSGGKYLPISFEIFGREVFIALYMRYSKFCENKKEGDYRFSFFKWDGGDWRSVDTEEIPFHLMRANLGYNPWGVSVEEDYSGLVAWGEKKLDWLDKKNRTPKPLKKYIEDHRFFCQ